MKEVDVMSPTRWTTVWGSLDSAMKERSREVTPFRYLNQTALAPLWFRTTVVFAGGGQKGIFPSPHLPESCL